MDCRSLLSSRRLRLPRSTSPAQGHSSTIPALQHTGDTPKSSGLLLMSLFFALTCELGPRTYLQAICITL